MSADKDSRVAPRCVFVTGASGYLARALIPRLIARGHRVRALARAASVAHVPEGAEVVVGDALDPRSYADAIAPADTLVHLVGVAHPSPAKAAAFTHVDLASVSAALTAAKAARVAHFVYVSVAHPAPMMHAFVAARQEAERRIRRAHLAATVLRPWYVLGPGHRWPYALLPLYALLERWPATRDAALRLGLVRLAQMTRALVHAVEYPAAQLTVLDVPAIKRLTS